MLFVSVGSIIFVIRESNLADKGRPCMYFIMFYGMTLVVFSFCSQFLATELNEVVDLNCLFELPDAH